MATQQIFKRHTMQVAIEAILKGHNLLAAWQDGKLTSVKLTRPNYMPLVIEQVTTYGPSGVNQAVSIAHYFEQNGDLMRDPEGSSYAVRLAHMGVTQWEGKFDEAFEVVEACKEWGLDGWLPGLYGEE